MQSLHNNQCPIACPHRIENTLWKRIFKSKKPLCDKFQENEASLTLDFPNISKEQLAIFDNNFECYEFPKDSSNGLVIVETRKDKRFEIVLKNIAYYVPNWKLHIFHSDDNKEFIENILGKQCENVVFHKLAIAINSNQDYNFVLKDKGFWKKLQEHQRVLIFQTDSLMFRFGIEQFLTYDYVGAVWPWWKKRFNTVDKMGGNGGFSLRNVNKMIEIIEKHSETSIDDMPDYQNEDVFFSYHLFHDKNAILPNWNIAMRFASESFLCKHSLGVHQAWKFHDDFQLAFENKES